MMSMSVPKNPAQEGHSTDGVLWQGGNPSPVSPHNGLFSVVEHRGGTSQQISVIRQVPFYFVWDSDWTYVHAQKLTDLAVDSYFNATDSQGQSYH